MTDVAAPIGGEMHYPADPYFRYVTDSGRSSLRLIVDRWRAKRFALPDFLCGVIVDTFKACGVDFAFYRVRDDFTIDYDSIEPGFDALYVIDFFGKPGNVDRGRLARDVVVVYDCVFQPSMVAPPAGGDWVWFNSFRKISPLPDGSLVVSTIALDAQSILPGPAPFVATKRRAKAVKDAFLRSSKGSEEDYLALYRHGENQIDAQAVIHAISPDSLAMLFDFQAALPAERTVRQANYDFLRHRLGRFAIDLGPGFKTLFVMSVDDRDALRAYLAERRIYLPTHWPNPLALSNSLYDRVLSVPVDSRYGPTALARVATEIELFMARSKPADVPRRKRS
jgi:hypothetical protein